jgi:hypothetical protein
VKTGLEQTRVTITGDANDQAQLHLEFAQRRLEEITALIAQGRFRNVSQATEAFEADVQKALAAFQVVAKNDPARSGELASKIAAALSQYAQVLNTLAIDAPDVVRPEVEKALQLTLNPGEGESGEPGDGEFSGVVEAISADAWTIGGRTVHLTPQTEIDGSIEAGDLVEVRALLGPGNTLVALSIDLEEDPANGNENDNEDANENDDGAENENGNENENENDNDDGAVNENEDDDENENGNANDDGEENDNENDSGEDNENENGNENENANDDGDENENENGNENDDGDDSNDNDDNDSNDNENANDNDDDSNDNENVNDNDDDADSNDNENQNEEDSGGSGSGGGDEGDNENGDD